MVPLPDELAVPITRWLNDCATTAPLDVLRTVSQLRAALADVEALAAVAARGRGYTWEQIANALLTSRSNAHARFGHLQAAPDQQPPAAPPQP